MKNQLKIVAFILLSTTAVLSSCGGESSNTTETSGRPFNLLKEYRLFDKNDLLYCYECDRCWTIQFTDESRAVLFSGHCATPRAHSCRADLTYEYNKDSKTITIKSISNSHATYDCQNKFYGDWVWSNGSFKR